MAIWQFSFYIIPRENLFQYFKEVPAKIDINENETILFWRNKDIENLFSINIFSDLGREDSWSENIQQFGKIDETCIEIFQSNKYNSEIQIRLDLRTFSQELINNLINFINNYNALIITENKTVIEPHKENLLAEILLSNAYKYIVNPSSILT